MLIQFAIKNFGSIKDKMSLNMEATSSQDLEDYYVLEPIPGLRLLKLAIIYGPNASGKTTVFNALEFLRDLVTYPENKKNDILGFEPFLLDKQSSKKASEFDITFIIEKIRYSYKIEFCKTHIISEKLTYYPKGREAEFFSRKTNIEKQLSILTFGSTIKITAKDLASLESNTLWNNSVLGAYTKTNISSKELKGVVDWFTEVMMELVTPKNDLFAWTSSRIEQNDKLRQSVIDLLRKADVQISDFEIVTKEEKVDDKIQNALRALEIKNETIEKTLKNGMLKKKDINFTHLVKSRNKDFIAKLPKDMESRGTLRYYGLSGILSVLLSGPKIIAIDEIETSLHPDLMKHFILLFLANSQNSQLLLTTHNVFFLEERDIIRNDSIWFTEKKEDGATELYSLNDFDSTTFRKGSSVINSYKIGRLGAKPNLGNIFINSDIHKDGKS